MISLDAAVIVAAEIPHDEVGCGTLLYVEVPYNELSCSTGSSSLSAT